ncbi:MAG: hypothetical protein H7320_13735 [Ferruginibacter sp.]|nr:hypothetical protein [Ferruginibacter sp.]
MKKKYFFCLIKNHGNTNKVAGVHLYMYRLKKNGKFYVTHRLDNECLFGYWAALWYWIRFNLPKRLSRNANMFGYQRTTGKVKLFKIPND